MRLCGDAWKNASMWTSQTKPHVRPCCICTCHFANRKGTAAALLARTIAMKKLAGSRTLEGVPILFHWPMTWICTLSLLPLKDTVGQDKALGHLFTAALKTSDQLRSITIAPTDTIADLRGGAGMGNLSFSLNALAQSLVANAGSIVSVDISGEMGRRRRALRATTSSDASSRCTRRCSA